MMEPVLKQISVMVAVWVGRGCEKAANWAREKRLREGPTQHSAEMAIFAWAVRRVLFKMGIVPIFDAEIVPSYK